VSIYLLVSLFLLTLPVQAANDCGDAGMADWERIAEDDFNYLEYQISLPRPVKTKNTYSRNDPGNPKGLPQNPGSLAEQPTDFGVKAQLSKFGTLKFNMYTKRGGRYSKLQAKYEMRNIMAHFGDRVQGIDAVWTVNYGPDHSNLDQFNHAVATALGRTKPRSAAFIDQDIIEAAAWNTWTGKQARQYGFTEIEFINTKPSPSLDRLFDHVDVFFVKP